MLPTYYNVIIKQSANKGANYITVKTMPITGFCLLSWCLDMKMEIMFKPTKAILRIRLS